jgi:aspartokinase
LGLLFVAGAEAQTQVIRWKIPIRIKNVKNPTGRGTVIQPDTDPSTRPPSPDIETLVTQGASLSTLAEMTADAEERHRRKRLPTAVTIKEHIVVLNVNSNRKSVSHGFLARIFGTLDRFGVVVDLISTSEVHVSMAIEDGVGLSKKVVNKLVLELEKSGTVSVWFLSCGACVVMVVGAGLVAHGHGDSVAGGAPDATHGGYCGEDVCHAGGGEYQH